jgi:hypothetical protein
LWRLKDGRDGAVNDFKNPEAPAVKREAEEDWGAVIPRGAIFGRRVGDPPKDESEQLHSVPGLRRLD